MAEEKVKQTKIDELIPDDKNFNKGTEYGNSLIEKSLRKFGAGRSVLIDKNNRIIAGNKTIENASAIGLDDVIVVETDGKKIVAVKRTDIDLDSKEGRELALADNQTSAVNFSIDEDVLKDVSDELEIDLGEWGISLDENDSNPYVKKIESPIYEPNGECPATSDLYDDTKTKSLIADIDKSGIDDDVKTFLKLASMRHVVFDYGKIAEYYCHAPADVQRLFEDSALIIIDFKDAVRGGYVKLRDEIRKVMFEDVFAYDETN